MLWLCCSSRKIHQTVLAEGRHRYLIDSLFRDGGYRFSIFYCLMKFKETLQVLEAIGPPYSSEFVHLFMPMVENDEITGTMRGDGENDPVSEFIGNHTQISKTPIINLCFLVYCKANYTAVM